MFLSPLEGTFPADMTINITIINDNIFEDGESFLLTLMSSTLGLINETMVNIIDDEKITVATDIAITEIPESNDVEVMVNITTPLGGLAVNTTVDIDIVITDITTEG